jgi:uncharacterized membrane protein required for colicin V production
VEAIQPFDLVIALALLGMFVVGYYQGVVRRLLGIAAIVFSLILGAQLRQPLGQYLANEWGGIVPSYSFMMAFAAVFVASAVALSIGIQITYRPAPLFPRYPVLDELLGGVLGVVQGVIILVATFLILDPYFSDPAIRDTAGRGEFGLLRTLYEFLDPTLTASILRDTITPGVLLVLGFLFPQDVREVFARIPSLLARS